MESQSLRDIFQSAHYQELLEPRFTFHRRSALPYMWTDNAMKCKALEMNFTTAN